MADKNNLLAAECIAVAKDELRLVLESEKRVDTLYHYTDTSGLLGILKAKQVWATDSRFLNDSQELSYGREVALDVLSSHFTLSTARDVVLGGRQFVATQMFVASFSANPDVLSQWRAYAGDGLGYAVGFDSAHPLPREGASVQFRPVVYDEAKQRAAIDRILAPALKPIREAGRELYTSAKAFCEALELVLPYFKNPGFKEEGEWRAVVQHGFADSVAPTGFRASRYGVTPHIFLGDPSGRLPLRELFLGPKIAKKLGTEAARELLDSHGYFSRVDEERITPYDVLIRCSRTSYQ